MFGVQSQIAMSQLNQSPRLGLVRFPQDVALAHASSPTLLAAPVSAVKSCRAQVLLMSS